MAVAAQWEGTQPGVDSYWEKPSAQREGLASATESLRADQAPPVIGEIGRNSKVSPEDVQNVQTADHFAGVGNMVVALAALDARDHPIDLVAPAPAPTAGVAYAAQIPYIPGNVEQWRGLVAANFPEHTVDTVLLIMNCESGGNPNVTGAAGEKGLMQELPEYHQAKADAIFGAGADLYDPEVNIAVAAVISGGGTNWAAWTCARLVGLNN